MKKLHEQNKTLKKYFDITVSIPVTGLPKEHSESEGTFLIPKWEKLGKTYNEAVARVLEALKKDRPCYDYRDGNWSEKYLRPIPRIVPEIVSGQMGKKWKGVSVKSVRKNAAKDEVLLGIYEIGIILLTNPDILKSYDDLWIDCAGDEYSYDGDGVFSRSPFFEFFGGRLRFGAGGVDFARVRCGAVSVFPPQLSIELRPLDPIESLIEQVKKAGYVVYKKT